MHIYIYNTDIIYASEVGVMRPTAKSFRFVSFRSFVRVCARSGCRVEIGLKCSPAPFPFSPGKCSLFPCVIMVKSYENNSEIKVK